MVVEEIARKITELSGTYSGYEIFSDWIKAFALSISNSTDMIHGKLWKEREKQYMNIVQKYGEEKIREFCQLNGMLVDALDENIEDVLGKVYMMAGLGSKQTGQFFTPFHISELVGKLAIPSNISPENHMKLNEPSAGGGGMIIAAVKVLKDRGVNPQHCMDVVAQDLDWKGVYMTYVQLSLLGIKAAVVQGDSLGEPFIDPWRYSPERVLYTPARKGMIF